MNRILTPGGMRFAGFALLVATFLVGALAGAAVDRVLTASERDPQRHATRDGETRAYVIDQIQLRPEQRAAIDDILERRSERMQLVWKEYSPRMRALTDSARADIMAVLTPDQRAEYEARLEARRAQRERERERERERGSQPK